MITPQNISLKGKTAVITGGASGIGLSIAKSFATFGAQVAILDKDADKGKEVGSLIEGALFCHADVSLADEVNRAKAEVLERFGGVDILVNNVGDFMQSVKPLVETEESEWDALYNVNFKSILLCTKAFVPLMQQRFEASGQGGSVINISSIEGYRGIPNCAVYGAFKTAIGGLVRSLSLEFAPWQIRVNAIAPETTETEQVNPAAFTKAEHMDKWPYWNPLGRYGQARDHAGAALFLASDLSQWVTGTTLHVDGGALAAAGFYRIPGEKSRWTLAPVIEESGFIF